MRDKSSRLISRRSVATAALASGLLLLRPSLLASAESDLSSSVDPQPYFAAVRRAIAALAKVGAPVSAADAQELATLSRQNDRVGVGAAEKILEGYTFAHASIDSGGSLHLTQVGGPTMLVEQGWRVFLVRVTNLAGSIASIRLSAGSGLPTQVTLQAPSLAQRAWLDDTLNKAPRIEKEWLLSELYGMNSMDGNGPDSRMARLSGIPVEYHVVQLFSRDAGLRHARLTLYTSTAGSEGEASRGGEFDFNSLPSRRVTLNVLDADGTGCMASLTIKDRLGQIYPLQAMRLAPDMFFQEHVYRADGETMRLPDARYTVASRRGPEYLTAIQTVAISAANNRIDVRLQRWIDPARWGWYSGDTHIHPSGCAHYENPTEGVSPETIIRHVRGEGLAIGDVLTWGPGWYYQKQFFTGHAKSPAATLEHLELQTADNASLRPHATPKDPESTLRYDVEVSGFPSSHAGHLVLLRLNEQDYPGTILIEEWPSWNLPILQWARAQGAVGGYAHCGNGLVVDSKELPNYEIPDFDSNGANEALVDVTHGLVDFLSGCDTQPIAELNAWYHLLNCGCRLPLIGETDWPCISGERVGIGRSYVRLDRRPVGEGGYDAWIRALQQGRLYCGDGRSHFLDFTVNGQRGGERDVALETQLMLEIEALVAARLDPEPSGVKPGLNSFEIPAVNGWHLENARISGTREVAVERVINGLAVDQATLVADGTPRSIAFTAALARSSWVALRIFPSAHTHPIFVQVGGKPIRASKRSARWCRSCVDKVWEVKSPLMRERERAAAANAFDHARQAYDKIIAECEVA